MAYGAVQESLLYFGKWNSAFGFVMGFRHRCGGGRRDESGC